MELPNKLLMNYFFKALLMRFISSIEFALSHNFFFSCSTAVNRSSSIPPGPVRPAPAAPGIRILTEKTAFQGSAPLPLPMIPS